jgi:CheY-like chemotaxis protein
MAPPEAPILVIEDNAETSIVLRRVLGVKGYSSVTVANGDKAFAYLRAGNPVRLIILDLHLPGVDGLTIHRELKADPELSAIPVVVFSAIDAEDAVKDVVAYVRKGSDPDVLLAAIARALATPPGVTDPVARSRTSASDSAVPRG